MNRVHIPLLLLSFGSGAADAFAFLALGGIFTANMTGNLILTGMFIRPGFPLVLLSAVVAIVVFTVVLYAAFRLTAAGTGIPVRPECLRRRLVIPSVAIQALVVVAWIVAPGTRGTIEQCGVLALSAAALALQTVAAKKLSDVAGVTTTYVTGTLTTTMEALAERNATGQRVRVLSILALPAGAVTATAALMVQPCSARPSRGWPRHWRRSCWASSAHQRRDLDLDQHPGIRQARLDHHRGGLDSPNARRRAGQHSSKRAASGST